MKYPISKYVIDGILAIIFLFVWVWIVQIDFETQKLAMLVSAFTMVVYTTMLRLNKNFHE